jgi:hypothetical protein
MLHGGFAGARSFDGFTAGEPKPQRFWCRFR